MTMIATAINTTTSLNTQIAGTISKDTGIMAIDTTNATIAVNITDLTDINRITTVVSAFAWTYRSISEVRCELI